MFLRIFLASITLSLSVWSSTTQPPRYDVVFIVDTSVGDSFASSKKLIVSFLDYFSVSPATTRVSMFALSGEVRLKFHFKSFVNRECVAKAVNRLNASISLSTSSSLVKATMAARKLFKQYPRDYRQKIVIHILGNWLRYSPRYAFVYSDVTSFAVVHGLPDDNLEYLVTPFKSEHLFFVQHGFDMAILVKKIPFQKSYVACTGTGTVRDECHRVCECKHGRKVNCYRLRKELSRLSNKERERLFRAIHTVGMSAEYKKMHDKFVWVHENYMCTKIHNEDYFNPWHRWYLVLFENTLREIDCRITLPFWDWSYWVDKNDLFNTKEIWRPLPYDLGGDGTLSRSMCVQTGIFRENLWEGFQHEKTKKIIKKSLDMMSKKEKWLFKTSTRMNKKRCLRRRFSISDNIKPLPTLDKMLGVPLNQFRDIMLYLRYEIHGSVHMAVGGTMASSWSADVPEFWLHHVFLDKVWWLWQERGEKFKNAYYDKLNKNMFLWPYTQKQLIDVMNLPKCVRYKYDGWPEHKIVPFHGLNNSNFAGNYLERSVCDGNDNFEKYQYYMSSVFPDKSNKIDHDDDDDDDDDDESDTDKDNDKEEEDHDKIEGDDNGNWFDNDEFEEDDNINSKHRHHVQKDVNNNNEINNF